MAHSRHAESIAIQRNIDDPRGLGHSLLAVAEQQFESAARQFGAAEKLSQFVIKNPSPIDPAQRDQALAVVRDRLGEPVFAALRAEGRALPLGQAIELAMAA